MELDTLVGYWLSVIGCGLWVVGWNLETGYGLSH